MKLSDLFFAWWRIKILEIMLLGLLLLAWFVLFFIVVSNASSLSEFPEQPDTFRYYSLVCAIRE